MCLCVDHHVLSTEASWWGSKDGLIYCCNDKSLGVSLILCPSSRIIMLDSPLEVMAYLATFLIWQWYQVWISSCGALFKPNQKLVGYSSHGGCAPAAPVDMSCQPNVIIAFRIYKWVRWTITFLLQWCMYYIPTLWKLDNRDEASRSASACSVTQSIWYLQQWRLTIKFWRLTNSIVNDM